MQIPFLDSSDFESKISDSTKVSVIEIMASWCGNCKNFESILEAAADEQKALADFYKMDADSNREFVKNHKILGVPSLLIFRHGVLIHKKIGVQTKSKISKMIAPLADYSPQEAQDNAYKSILGRIFG